MAPTRSLLGPTDAEQDRTVGRVLGARYRVLSRLGEGGMGTVYLCEHAVLGRRYAVKVLRPDLAADAELLERFRNEAIAASQVGGENVVDVLDFGTSDDGACYYVMEALEGRSLGAIMVEEGPLEVRRALALVEQVCRALGAAHARGVVHRDVKPDNVFVVRREDGAERVKVIDFGISQVPRERSSSGRLTRAGTIIGTPEYMAPEQASGDSVDHRADVYALGVVAYEMLTGTLPIVANTPIATLVAHQTRTPAAPSLRRAGIPPEVDQLVLAALAKRPEDRPASMDAFAAAIAAIRDRSAPSARGPAPMRPTVALREGLPGSRRRAHLRRAGIAAAVALATLATAFTVWSRRDRSIAGGDPNATAATASPRPTPAFVRTATAAPVPVPTSTPIPPPTAAPVPTPTPTASAPPTSTATAAPVKQPARAAPDRATPRPSRDRHLEDPYGTGLKPDPFE